MKIGGSSKDLNNVNNQTGPEEDLPVEDLVNAPKLNKKSLEIKTNKGKLVVTTTTDGTKLHNVILEKKTDKPQSLPKTAEALMSSAADNVDEESKKSRVR